MVIDESISDEMNNNATVNVEKICSLLSDIEVSLVDYMADFVASLCGVDKKEMLSGSIKNYGVHARWFLWHCIRYLTNESYEKIAMRMSFMDSCVTVSGVGTGITKIAFLIENEPIWKKRWVIMKRIIKSYNDKHPYGNTTPNVVKITIEKPADVDVEVEIKK